MKESKGRAVRGCRLYWVSLLRDCAGQGGEQDQRGGINQKSRRCPLAKAPRPRDR
ncbi:MAG: hypothetical protein MZU91_06360 [Desulfosudis oleivorans]|nr:hypothetical protein [Desulfosudis oleivorans]